MAESTSSRILAATAEALQAIGRLRFLPPVTHVYNPLVHATEVHTAYVEKFAKGPRPILFLGMNPGPYGMAQTGVPFGEVTAVKEYLKLEGEVKRPPNEHPKRPIDGLDCKRSEVSGKRLWGLIEDRYPDAEDFFKEHYVHNYCPLVFMESEGKNRTPDKLPAEERAELEQVCDQFLLNHVRILKPKWVVAVGVFAEAQVERVLEGNPRLTTKVARILHPSPASPAANKNWAETAEAELIEQKVWKKGRARKKPAAKTTKKAAAKKVAKK